MGLKQDATCLGYIMGHHIMRFKKHLFFPVNLSGKAAMAFGLIWLMAFGLIYMHHKKLTLAQTNAVLHERTSLVQQYLDLTLSFVDFMRKQMELNVQLAAQSRLAHPQADMLINYPEYGVWALNEHLEDGTVLPKSKGAITGLGDINKLSADVRHEINAALALELDIGSEMSNDLEFVWAYYTSQHGFVLLAPSVSVRDFHFTNMLFSKPFWVPAIPENNRQRKTVISDLYDDAGGKGLMISISAPVYQGDLFKGVVSLDIGLDKLRQDLQIGSVAGDSYLVDEEWKLIASPYGFDVGEKIFDTAAIQFKDGLFEHKGHWYFQVPIFADQIYLIHKISSADRAYQILTSMAFHLSLISLGLIAAYLVFSLRNTLNIVEEMAMRDALTNLLNRRAIKNQAMMLLQEIETPVSILVLDIDHFKRINDTYGHDVGDTVLKQIAAVLQSCSRNIDLVGRIGGEEFILILPDTAIEEAEQIAERIRTAVEQSKFSSKKLHVTLSVGCAQRQPAESFEDIFRRSDQALYDAKHGGRNQIKCLL